jgi:hypothetical protein
MYRLHHEVEKNRLTGTTLAITSSPIRVILMMKAMSFFETLILTRATRRNIPKEGILLRDHWIYRHLGAWEQSLWIKRNIPLTM